MSQGLIGGTLWGVLAAGFSLVVVSQVALPPGRGPVVEVAAEVPPVVVAATPDPAAVPVVTAAADPPATPDVAVRVTVPQPQAPAKPAAPVLAAAPVAPAPQPAKVATPPATATATAQADPATDPAALKLLPQPAAPEPPAEVATAEPAPAPGAKFVSVVPKATPKPAPVKGTAASIPATPPRVVTAAPARVAALRRAAGAPILPALAPPPAAARPPAAVADAGPPPAAPVRPPHPLTPTLVVTMAPQAALPALLTEAETSAPAATARGGFQPGRMVPVEAPAAADLPPATGSLPPPPPLTPEEAAILAEVGAIPPGAPDQGLPGVIVLTEAADPAKPSILKKSPPLKPTPSLAAKGQVPATERLPKIVPVAPTPAPQSATAPEALVTLPDDAPPIDRYARPFDNAAGKPLFAVVLIDTGDPQIDRAALAAIPFPVTFALDPTAPESALAASIYRAAGQEVVMLATGLPAGATAADIEVSFGAHEAALPEAVAVLDLEAGGFQGDRPLSTLVVPVLKGQGRGLLSWDRGLNAASQVARREGLRSGVIFRRLDGEGEPVAQIRRYLDRAAFKAAQDGRVIVAGETRPDTVQALLEWAVEGRASSVALAPLTAALRAD